MNNFVIDKTLNQALRKIYNPDSSILRQSQMRMLEMLSFIDKICQEHQIVYWIESGTLLGAARHGGFIPWDDDADICMPIKDYLRFKEIMINGSNDDYALQCHDTDPNYYGTWGVLRDLHSEMSDGRQRLEGFKYKGLQVDIFPIDDRCNKKLWKICRQYFAYFVNAPLFEGRISKFFRWCVPLSYKVLNKVIIPFFRLITPSDNTALYYRYGMFWYRHYPKPIVYPLKKITFEGIELNAPNDIDRYLTECFGDWRKIPSTENRETHHFKVAFK